MGSFSYIWQLFLPFLSGEIAQVPKSGAPSPLSSPHDIPLSTLFPFRRYRKLELPRRTLTIGHSFHTPFLSFLFSSKLKRSPPRVRSRDFPAIALFCNPDACRCARFFSFLRRLLCAQALPYSLKDDFSFAPLPPSTGRSKQVFPLLGDLFSTLPAPFSSNVAAAPTVFELLARMLRSNGNFLPPASPFLLDEGGELQS